MVPHSVFSAASNKHKAVNHRKVPGGFFAGDINSVIKYFPETDASCTITIPGNSYFFQDQAHPPSQVHRGLQERAMLLSFAIRSLIDLYHL